MIKEGKSKRAFFKKLAVAVGLVAAANYTRTLISAGADPVREANDRSANDVNALERAWRQRQLVLMSDNEKKRMLDEILVMNDKNKAWFF